MTITIPHGPNADLIPKIIPSREEHVRRLAAVRRCEANRVAEAERAAAAAWFDQATNEALDTCRGGLLAERLSILTDVYACALDLIDADWARAIAGGAR